jgi:hypothetical protein
MRTVFCGLAALAALAFPELVSGASIVIDVDVRIDGRSLLIVQGNTLQWHNLSFCAPGQHFFSCGDTNLPTTISTSLDGVPVLVDQDWFPAWPSGNSGDVFSDLFSGLDPAPPASDSTVSLDALVARESLTILQLPSAANGYALILDFDDTFTSGSAIYSARITIDTVPEPSTFGLVAASLFLVGSLRRKWAARR